MKNRHGTDFGEGARKPNVDRVAVSYPLCVALAVLLAAACDPDPSSETASDAATDASTDAGRDAGARADAGQRPDAGSFLEGLFGGTEAVLPGNFCTAQEDRCRGHVRLLVCLDDTRDPAGTVPTCRACESDAECAFEYPYFNSPIRCDAGECVLPSGNECAANSDLCRTARAGNFVCVEGDCLQCIDASECVNDYGAGWECRFTGQCEMIP